MPVFRWTILGGTLHRLLRSPGVLEQLPTAVTWMISLYIGFFAFSFSTCFLLLSLFSCSVVSDSLWPHGLQHARLPCPSTSPRACSNSCPLSQWYHPIVLSSVLPFSSCLQSLPASGSACSVGDLGSIPELGKSPGGGHGNTLQYSCLESRHG